MKNMLESYVKVTLSHLVHAVAMGILSPPLKDPSDLLKNLLTGNTQRHKQFHENIRAYNSSLAFPSLCLTGQEFKFKNPGPYCYRINGQLHHALSQMIYDHEHELDYCMKPFTGLDAALLLELQQMIKM